MDLERKDSINKSIIEAYREVTGIYSQNAVDLKRIASITEVVNKDAAEQLPGLLRENDRLTDRRNGWRRTALIGIPVGIVIGGAVGIIYTATK